MTHDLGDEMDTHKDFGAAAQTGRGPLRAHASAVSPNLASPQPDEASPDSPRPAPTSVRRDNVGDAARREVWPPVSLIYRRPETPTGTGSASVLGNVDLLGDNPTIGSLFSGFGGLDLGVQAALGGTIAWHVENDPDASAVLAHRFPGVPNLGDITGVDWEQVERVAVLLGGFPCQDLSAAGRREGLRPDNRSGLWSQMVYAVSVLRPRLVIAENVRGLLSARAHSQVEPCTWCLGDDAGPAMRALGVVLADLADLGYDAAWCGLRAAEVGAPHERFRVFVVAADSDLVGSLRAGTPRGRQSEPAHDGAALADRERHPLRHQPVADARRGGASVIGDDRSRVRRVDAASADAPHGDQAHRGPVGAASSRAGRRLGGEPRTGSRTGRRDAAARVHELGPGSGRVDFGGYAPAIARWEHLLGRVAPAPTVDGRRADRVLNPAFVEWMQGVEPGWVTAVPGISRSAALRILGNGVVPQQVSAALPWLLAALAEPAGEAA
ncbi:DNA (cytosine-5)-methyltransferase 1 [Lentzea albidocapillata subsp. violacea]|uniref:DNA (cytosine-5-)-methyltransferase n=1 Tax=Lentzea albidocapillata subsp. violacea TaxID=128104 RepID=A0A1G9I0D9_9PSEU|nr:DNA (cytosine-5-)-methyltransferase [Lentzea albidocapillata]SDL18688.1 DNA (cytosine-5)-methyltransferase 1 [Lentzea albidocapillata subsp. violacea]